MPEPTSPGNGEALAAIAAITGQSVPGATEIFCAIKDSAPDQTPASAADISKAVGRLCTRIGLAPALDQQVRERHIRALRELAAEKATSLTRGDLHAWDQTLRGTPEKIPTLERESVALPQMPEHQQAMWATLLDFEETDPPPWVLVGGQMTALHLTEHAITVHRPTDDGDVVVGVWTRRDALRSTTSYLTDNGFTESPTSDGYGYRFIRDRTTIDVMLPEGLDRQRRYPKTSSGRPGLAAPGGNQALTRAERVPVNLNGREGYIRRPTLLGSLVVKARAWVVDSRNPERHAQDLVALSAVALRDPRSVISQARPDDRRAIRIALQHLPAGNRLLRAAEDPVAVHAFLSRLAQPPG
ncbi:hypothetical protein [Mycobacterium talmoniae]|uniref:Uncharacterized protein n=1 Tax=Mycobacterium talmoniae TaxID=1858794 RepID=A0A2S8BDS3_9MYCO|nr:MULTISPECIES: hypothetical protein [Mycobacterium]PQM44779.1 hypothetical protein C1Y40_05060 [Mycobacterium talmoniae]TDH56291.1 hypothetical protein E2F47_07435 [Mycobacterium eburneum]